MDSTRTSGTTEAVQQVADTAGAHAQAIGEAASQSTQHVAETAKEQVRKVTDEAASQMGNVVDQAKQQLHQQAEAQTEKIAETLGRVREQAEALVSGRPEEAGPLADYARQAVDRLGRIEQHVESRGFDGLVEDTKQFARRRPGLFLLGAAAAGFGIGRLLRNGAASAASSPSDDGAGAQAPGLRQEQLPMQLGTPAVGSQAVGSQAVGSQAVGSQAVGSQTAADQTVAMPQPVFYDDGTSSPALSTSLPGS